MKPHLFIVSLSIMLAAATVLVGCGPKEKEHHDDPKEEAHGEDDVHEHGDESPSGATFKAGKGVMLSDETRRSLELEVADVGGKKLPTEISFAVQVFGEVHHHLLDPTNHSGCDMHGSAFLTTNTAATVKPGQLVNVFKSTNQSLPGVVLAVQKAMTLGESEIVVGISNATSILKPGEFVSAVISMPRVGAVPAIPQSALLRTAGGTFVYAVNGDAYFRTAVKTGAESEGWVEITEGLRTGDQVVTKPVQSLWLIELRATKGGGHSH